MCSIAWDATEKVQEHSEGVQTFHNLVHGTSTLCQNGRAADLIESPFIFAIMRVGFSAMGLVVTRPSEPPPYK